MGKKFNYLNVPSHWKHYWTRYPEGYTILEALLDWVGQVDSMVDNVNDWNEYLDNFVATFDENLQGEVVSTLSEWQDSGFLDVVIDEALQTQLDVLENDINQQRINIVSVGAVGDNATDNTEIIQNTIDTLYENGGGVIFFPKGTYLFTELTIPSEIHIEGAGEQVTILKSLNSETSLKILGEVGKPTEQLSFSHLSLYFPNIQNGIPAVLVENTYYFNFNHVRIDGTFSARRGIGMLIKGDYRGYYGTFEKTQFAGFDLGIRLEDSANAHRFIGSWFLNCNRCVEVINSAGNLFSGVMFQDFYEKAIHIQGTSTGNTFVGCYLEGKGNSETITCGIEIDSTVRSTNLIGNLYMNLLPEFPQLIDNSNMTFRLEWDGSSYEEVIKIPSFLRLASLDNTTKPSATKEKRGTLLVTTENNDRDRVKAIIHDKNNNPVYGEFIMGLNNLIDTQSFKTISGTIEQYDAHILVGVGTTEQERALTYSPGYKMLRYHNGTSWNYLQNIRAGNTSSRPSGGIQGACYFDTTLNKPIWWNGTVWVDANGTTV